ncbi:MAG: hypothetical protein N2645_00985 [Clostridia bacterium]|nr:hypothetical protein [Clostridia bacterium]
MESTIIDYFERRGIFDPVNECIGMQASQIPEAFIAYFESQDEEMKRQISQKLIDISLADGEKYLVYAYHALKLVLELCMRNFKTYFYPHKTALENALNDKKNLEVWCNSPQEGKLEKAGWHYSLILWGTLYILKSQSIGTSYTYLTDHAKSSHFRDALKGAREMYDKYFMD